MKRLILAGVIATGILTFTTPGTAQFVAGSAQNSAVNGNGGMKGKRNGPNDGTGNQGQRPQDGSGNGAKSRRKGGDGICDGTGPKGQSPGGRGSMGGRGGGRR
jgi:hypothetical protein